VRDKLTYVARYGPGRDSTMDALTARDARLFLSVLQETGHPCSSCRCATWCRHRRSLLRAGRDLPKSARVTCRLCRRACRFLARLYATSRSPNPRRPRRGRGRHGRQIRGPPLTRVRTGQGRGAADCRSAAAAQFRHVRRILSRRDVESKASRQELPVPRGITRGSLGDRYAFRP